MRNQNWAAYFNAITGPMFSGKTRELQRLYTQFKFTGYAVQVFRRDIDARYGSGIRTHDGIEFQKDDVFMARTVEDIDKQLKHDTDVVMIDEAQWYTETLVQKVEDWVAQEKIVIATILPLDYAGNVFGIAGDLLAKADYITPLHAICMHQENGVFCHEEATRSFRKVSVKEQLLVGGAESYEPRCRKHHFVLSEEKK